LTSFFTPPDAQTHIRDAARARRIAGDITQSDLAARSGVSLASLKRFEQTGQISLTSLLRLAMALNALNDFAALFPPLNAHSFDELERIETPRKRASGRRN
jgi:transcriptional regulator with XRE-family HTH domain